MCNKNVAALDDEVNISMLILFVTALCLERTWSIFGT